MTMSSSRSARVAAARRGRGAPERRTTARARGVSRRRDLLVPAAAATAPDQQEDWGEESWEEENWADDRAPESELWDDHPGTGPGLSRGGRVAVLVVLIVALVLAVVAVVMVVSGRHDASPTASPRTRSPGADSYIAPPSTVPVDTSLVRTTVLPSGEVAVSHWIHTKQPITRLTFAGVTVPGLSGLKPTGVVVRSRTSAGSSGTAVRYSPTVFLLSGGVSEVYVHYDLSGVVERDSSVAGRALVRVTSLDVRVDQPLTASTRQVAHAHVLAMACSAPSGDAGTLPCGRPVHGAWQVRLPGATQHDVVMAQLDLSGSS